MGCLGETCPPPPLPVRGHAAATAQAFPPLSFTPPLFAPPAPQVVHHQGPGEEPASLGPPLPSFRLAAWVPAAVGLHQQHHGQVCLEGSREGYRGRAGCGESAGTRGVRGSGETAR